MRPLPSGSLRAGLLALLVGTGLAAFDQGRSGSSDAGLASARMGPMAPPLQGYRPASLVRDARDAQADRCAVRVRYPQGQGGESPVILTDLVSDRDCPSELNAGQEITFELEVREPTRNLWWRRASKGFDVLHPSSGPIAAAGRSRVTLQDLVLDDSVTIEVMEDDRLVLSFTLRHF
jgi:hypothetical protein